MVVHYTELTKVINKIIAVLRLYLYKYYITQQVDKNLERKSHWILSI